MARISAAKPMFAKCKTNQLEDDTPYATPEAVGKMIGVEVKPQYKTATLHADDGIAEEKKVFNYADVILNTSTLPLKVAASMYGRNVTNPEDGDEIIDNIYDEPNYGAFGYIYGEVVNNVTSYVVVFLPRVKFDMPEEKFETLGENITFNTPTINGKAYANKDGDWRIKKSHPSMSTAISGLSSMFTKYTTQSTEGDNTVEPDDTEGTE